MVNHNQCKNKYKCEEFNPNNLNQDDLKEAICFGCEYFSKRIIKQNNYYKYKKLSNMKEHIERKHYIHSKIEPNYFGDINGDVFPKEE